MADALPEDDAIKKTLTTQESKDPGTSDTKKQDSTETTKTKTQKKKDKKISKNKKEAAEEEQADNQSDKILDSDKASKKTEGPAYPFVNENSDTEHLACKVTPFIEPKFDNKKPMRKGNNLMRKPGSPSRASGDYIQLRGTVVDENCLPIQGVVVEIWQTDSHGHYEWEYDRESYWTLPPEGKDNNFLYSGSAHTDNLGEFDFMTMMPTARIDEAPYINVIVKREGYEELHTRMYFAGQPLNDSDKSLASLSEDGKASLVIKGKSLQAFEGKAFYFPITLRGISPYKRF